MTDLAQVCANSYRNFHVKGFDYLCLHRSENFTRKAYFFGDNLTELPELVMPHNHRYSFDTTVVNGQLRNHTYRRIDNAIRDGDKRYDHFFYLTPLNGGDGFTWENEVVLRQWSRSRYGRRQRYTSYHTDIHTLEILKPDTIIVLDQYEDNVPVGVPTDAFRLAGSRQPPSLDGLYDRMDEDYAISLMLRLANAAI